MYIMSTLVFKEKTERKFSVTTFVVAEKQTKLLIAMLFGSSSLLVRANISDVSKGKKTKIS